MAAEHDLAQTWAGCCVISWTTDSKNSRKATVPRDPALQKD
jgi:hypothetical protein